MLFELLQSYITLFYVHVFLIYLQNQGKMNSELSRVQTTHILSFIFFPNFGRWNDTPQMGVKPHLQVSIRHLLVQHLLTRHTGESWSLLSERKQSSSPVTTVTILREALGGGGALSYR